MGSRYEFEEAFHLRRANKKLQSDVDYWRKHCESIETKVVHLEQTNSELSKQLDAIREENLQLKAEKERFQRKTEIIQEEKKSLKVQNDILIITSAWLATKNEDLQTHPMTVDSSVQTDCDEEFYECVATTETSTQTDPETTAKVEVPRKTYTSKSFKPCERKVSQFTNYSLHKDRRYSMKHNVDKTETPIPFLSFEDNSFFLSQAKAKLPKLKWKSKFSTSKSFQYSPTKLLALAPKPVQQVNDFSPLHPRRLFSPSSSSFHPPWNAISIRRIDETYMWNVKTTTVGPKFKWVPKVVSN